MFFPGSNHLLLVTTKKTFFFSCFLKVVTLSGSKFDRRWSYSEWIVTLYEEAQFI